MIKMKDLRVYMKKYHTEVIFLVTFVVLSFWVLLSSVPRNFNPNTLLEIEEGDSLKIVSNKLDDANLIKSKTLFSILLIIQSKDDNLVSGEYIFHERQSLFEIASRLTSGRYGIESKNITLTEGLTLDQMANLLEKEFINFNRNKFELETSLHEGYLFPDTYIFPENADTELIVKTLMQTFDDKINKKEVRDLIESSGKTLQEIIIMASIVEKEATAETRQEISNILWKRMEIGMALQVDATFVYERGKGTFDLTTEDLRTDSPYNTYTNAGLPPTAISNPGIESIKAAANIQNTDNLFFLSGSDGEMYYAETHDEHVINKQKFLR